MRLPLCTGRIPPLLWAWWRTSWPRPLACAAAQSSSPSRPSRCSCFFVWFSKMANNFDILQLPRNQHSPSPREYLSIITVSIGIGLKLSDYRVATSATEIFWWGSSVRDPDVFGPPGSVSQRYGSGSLYQSKNSKKDLDFYCVGLISDFLSLNFLKMYLQKLKYWNIGRRTGWTRGRIELSNIGARPQSIGCRNLRKTCRLPCSGRQSTRKQKSSKLHHLV